MNNNHLKQYQYDQHTNTPENEKQIQQHKQDNKRKELIHKCKHIRILFEDEFDPSDDVDSSTYLEMNGGTNYVTNGDENYIQNVTTINGKQFNVMILIIVLCL